LTQSLSRNFAKNAQAAALKDVELSPDFSVIIPTRGRPALLAQTIDSVRAQAGVTTEVIVVDDDPEGSAGAVAAAYDTVVYLRNLAPSNGRPAIARNLGWPKARGAFVHFLDDDDIVPAGHYAAVKELFTRSPNIGVVFGAVEPFGEGDLSEQISYFAAARRRARRFLRFGSRRGLAAAMLFGPTPLVCSAAVIRRECIAPLNGFNAELPLVEDVDFFARAIRKFGAAMLDGVSIRYRIHQSLMPRTKRNDLIDVSYQKIHACYRADYGIVDEVAMKIFTRLMEAAPC